MQFNSIEYLIFLPVVFLIYWLVPEKHRWLVLLISSYYFYMSWDARYAVLIIFTTVTTFYAALLISRITVARTRKEILIINIVINLLLLAYFKYFNFIIGTIANFVPAAGSLMRSIILPVGISFYTFQTFAYVIDVYRGEIEAENHLGIYAAFIAFFPQLVAGPIERSVNLLPQIKKPKPFSFEKSSEGLFLIAEGLFKKVVIADMAAGYVDTVFSNIRSYSGFSLVIALILFSLQIYCDFSGYSDIARGSAKLFNIDLMVNFRSPYFADSIHDFWARWHISLSTWFRDYVYIPLGGNRVSTARHIFNLTLTFLLSGLWHGASWHFVLWGLAHGILQVLEKYVIHRDRTCWICKGINIVITYCLVLLTWTLFRCNSVSDVAYYFTHLGFSGSLISGIRSGFSNLKIDYYQLGRIIIFTVVLWWIDLRSLQVDFCQNAIKKPTAKWAAELVLIVLLIVVFAQKGAGAQFVYFQF